MWTQGADVLLERTFPDTVFDELKAMGNNHSTLTAVHSTSHSILTVYGYYSILECIVRTRIIQANTTMF